MRALLLNSTQERKVIIALSPSGCMIKSLIKQQEASDEKD